MAWDLNLASLKKLALNSIQYSGMTEVEKMVAVKIFTSQWDQFLNSMVGALPLSSNK